MGWIIVALLAAAALGLLWRFGGLPPAGLQLAGAAICLALAGYALQGRPGQIGAVAQPRTKATPEDAAAIATRRAMIGRFNSDAQWLDYADTLLRLGYTRLAVTAVRSGLKDNPRSPSLWVGLGTALVAHSEGAITPAADFAFAQAARLSPDHPAPPFFRGLALAQAGRLDEAEESWRALMASTPADAPWRADIEARLALLQQARR